MPFGVLNFNSKINASNETSSEGLPGIFADMDNILICSKSEKEHW